MRKAIIPAFLLLLGSTVLGATVLREPIARAAAPITSVFVTNSKTSPVPVAEQNLDTNGHIKVHEQGTAAMRSANEEVAIVAEVPGDSVCEKSIYTVPAGKQFVMEYITGQGSGSSATDAWANITGAFESVSIIFQKRPLDFSTSQLVHLVFPPGTSLQFQGQATGSSNCHFYMTVGGYLQPTG